MNSEAAWQLTDRLWDDSIVPELVDYIRIPCKSPMFDPDWEANGFMEQAISQLAAWAEAHALPGMTTEVVRLPGRTPLILIEIPGSADGTVLLYGHLDKQPEMTGWRDDLGPWVPVIEDGKLYGRGGADDGYALFGALAAAHALREQGIPHADLKVVIEASEESGSPDLPAYMEALSSRIGEPELVVCLDSGCGDYDRLWCTTSLRGIVAGTLRVDVLHEGVHSGDAGGIVPSSFRAVRALLERIEDGSGRILPDPFSVEIPGERVDQARDAAQVLGDVVFSKFPLAAPLAGADPFEQVLNRTWRAALEVTGADGLPPIASAGNVHRPFTTLKLSIRVPPTCNAEAASAALVPLLQADPLPGTRVTFEPEQVNDGWNAPAMEPWLAAAVDGASREFFGEPVAYMGEGGTIPFMAMLGDAFPSAQFLVTGVLGPQSNAHGPNEFLHIATGKRVTACTARVLAEHANRS